MKKLICLFLVTIILLAVSSFPVSAEEGTEQGGISVFQPRYTIINSITASLSIASNGQATCSGRLVSSGSGSDCYLIMDLQQMSNTQWKTVKTWTASKINGTSVSLEKTYSVAPGTYRVKITGTVKNLTQGIEETAVKYSKETVN